MTAITDKQKSFRKLKIKKGREMELKFDPETHTYSWNGLKLVSVTQAIKIVFGEQPWYSDWHAGRGTAIHLAIHYLVQNKLNWESLDPRIENRIKAFQKFLSETQAKVLLSEVRYFSSKHKFAGTLDLILEIGSKKYIADIKSTIEPINFIQLGGYKILYEEQNNDKIKKGILIQLKDNGNYNLEFINLGHFRKLFLEVLDIAKFKEKYYGRSE